MMEPSRAVPAREADIAAAGADVLPARISTLQRVGRHGEGSTPMAVLNDTVVAAARHGDHEALASVYRCLAPKVQAYFRARGAEDPEGLTNEVFLNVLPRMKELAGGAAGLRSFVFSVAHARVVDEVRRRARRPLHTPYDPEQDARAEQSAETMALAAVGTSPVLESLQELGEEQRSVIALRVLGDLSLEQTAKVLGKSTGAVKQLQRRGLIALRALLEEGEIAG